MVYELWSVMVGSCSFIVVTSVGLNILSWLYEKRFATMVVLWSIVFQFRLSSWVSLWFHNPYWFINLPIWFGISVLSSWSWWNGFIDKLASKVEHRLIGHDLVIFLFFFIMFEDEHDF